jgi:hypothetical protein
MSQRCLTDSSSAVLEAIAHRRVDAVADDVEEAVRAAGCADLFGDAVARRRVRDERRDVDDGQGLRRG